jgi:hypothetical protein
MTVRQRTRTMVCLLAGVAVLSIARADPVVAVDAASILVNAAAATRAMVPPNPEPRATSLELMLSPQFQRRPRSRPDWWRDYSNSELPLDEPMLDRDSIHLVLQEDRTDGPDMLTLRYPFIAYGRLRGYAGAGLGQVVYLADHGVGPIMLFGRAERHRSVRAAAELGTDFRLSDSLFLGADVHWLDLADSASLLRTRTGMIDAGPWAARLTLGWRFR